MPNYFIIVIIILVLLLCATMYWQRQRKVIRDMDNFLKRELFHYDGVNNCEGTNSLYSLMFFYMETCPNCIEFKPIWNKCKKQLRNSRFGKSLCMTDISAENSNLISKYNITQFPTILLINNNSDDSGMPLAIHYEGPRTQEGLMVFVSQNIV
jgi:hypothetical protein